MRITAAVAITRSAPAAAKNVSLRPDQWCLCSSHRGARTRTRSPRKNRTGRDRQTHHRRFTDILLRNQLAGRAQRMQTGGRPPSRASYRPSRTSAMVRAFRSVAALALAGELVQALAAGRQFRVLHNQDREAVLDLVLQPAA